MGFSVRTIQEDKLTGLEIQQLLAEHEERMVDHSPPESRHVLNIDALKQPDITVWSMWNGIELMGCAALKHWYDELAEIKSMKTAPTFIRQGVGKQLLEHLITVAKQSGYKQLKLETGSMTYFAAARNLYLSHGFKFCEPFGDYHLDKNNVYMCLEL